MGEPTAEPDPGKSCRQIDQDGQKISFVLRRLASRTRSQEPEFPSARVVGEVGRERCILRAQGSEPKPILSDRTKVAKRRELRFLPPFRLSTPARSAPQPVNFTTSRPSANEHRCLQGHPRQSLERTEAGPDTSVTASPDVSGPPSRRLPTPLEISLDPLGDVDRPRSRRLPTPLEIGLDPLRDRSRRGSAGRQGTGCVGGSSGSGSDGEPPTDTRPRRASWW